MPSFIWDSILWYWVLTIFLFFQGVHSRNYNGGSEVFGSVLGASMTVGTLVGIGYLVYYAVVVSWWAPFIIGILGIIIGFITGLIERLVGLFVMSFVGFIGWPVSAYMMFHNLP